MKENCKIRLCSRCILTCPLIIMFFLACCPEDLTVYLKAELRQEESKMLAIIPLIDGYIGVHQASPLSFAALSDSSKMSIDTTGLRLIPGCKCPPYNASVFCIYSDVVFGKVWQYSLLYTNSQDKKQHPVPWTILCYQRSDPKKVKELEIDFIH